MMADSNGIAYFEVSGQCARLSIVISAGSDTFGITNVAGHSAKTAMRPVKHAIGTLSIDDKRVLMRAVWPMSCDAVWHLILAADTNMHQRGWLSYARSRQARHGSICRHRRP